MSRGKKLHGCCANTVKEAKAEVGDQVEGYCKNQEMMAGCPGYVRWAEARKGNILHVFGRKRNGFG